MPLIFLALAVQKQSYGIDTTSQIVFLMVVAVALPGEHRGGPSCELDF